VTGLLKRRSNATQERAPAQHKRYALLVLAKADGRTELEPEEDNEFRGYLKQMKELGAEIADIDEQIGDIYEFRDAERMLAETAAHIGNS
jgi:Asp-tRNA(Asn)/Glu-tRNA(Gln) amidotransferase A subunit family amidase